jgi:hypothetical protein
MEHAENAHFVSNYDPVMHRRILNFQTEFNPALVLNPADHVMYSLTDRDGTASRHGKWNYIFVRVTYKDDAKWIAFVDKIKAQNVVQEPIQQFQAWTFFEDQEKLDGASMIQATHYFQENVKSLAVKENLQRTRSSFYIYVNEESLESVVNPIRAKEDTGNFLVLVSVLENLDSQERGPWNLYTEEDDGDWSFKLIPADKMLTFYAEDAEDPNLWNLEPINEFPSYITGKHYGWRAHEFLEKPDPVGHDCYQMLKQIYGKGNERTRFFEANEASNEVQRIKGVESDDII